MTLYLNKPTYLHNSVHSSFSNLTKALEYLNESDKTIDNCGSSLENHTFDSLKDLIEKPTSKLRFILHPDEGKVGGKASGTAPAAAASTAPAAEPTPAVAAEPEPEPETAGTGEPAAGTGEPAGQGGGGRVKRTRNLRNRGNNKSQKKRKRKHLNYTKK